MPDIIIRTRPASPDHMPGEKRRRVYHTRGTLAVTRVYTEPTTRLHRFVLTHVPTGLKLDGEPTTLAKARRALDNLPDDFVGALGELGGWPENHSWEAGLAVVRSRPAFERAAKVRP